MYGFEALSCLQPGKPSRAEPTSRVQNRPVGSACSLACGSLAGACGAHAGACGAHRQQACSDGDARAYPTRMAIGSAQEQSVERLHHYKHSTACRTCECSRTTCRHIHDQQSSGRSFRCSSRRSPLDRCSTGPSLSDSTRRELDTQPVIHSASQRRLYRQCKRQLCRCRLPAFSLMSSCRTARDRAAVPPHGVHVGSRRPSRYTRRLASPMPERRRRTQPLRLNAGQTVCTAHG